MNNAKLTQTPQSFDFAGWSALLGDKDAKTIAPNTTLVRLTDSVVGVVLHSTTIVEFHEDGIIRLNTGGWNTPLTRQRMNLVLPQNLGVRNEKRNLHVLVGRGEHAIPGIVVPTQDNTTAEIDTNTGTVTV